MVDVIPLKSLYWMHVDNKDEKLSGIREYGETVHRSGRT